MLSFCVFYTLNKRNIWCVHCLFFFILTFSTLGEFFHLQPFCNNRKFNINDLPKQTKTKLKNKHDTCFVEVLCRTEM